MSCIAAGAAALTLLLAVYTIRALALGPRGSRAYERALEKSSKGMYSAEYGKWLTIEEAEMLGIRKPRPYLRDNDD